ncbi:hypothetical protein HY604_03430 [Candidatus Peregrinibacteria bacterium]|nr:hypothetical protein [Candidatus Peregrinibacteria bacterium]
MAKDQKNSNFELLEIEGINRCLDKIVRKLSEKIENKQMKKIEKQIKKL